VVGENRLDRTKAAVYRGKTSPVTMNMWCSRFRAILSCCGIVVLVVILPYLSWSLPVPPFRIDSALS
jgi:hypothetical protein